MIKFIGKNQPQPSGLDEYKWAKILVNMLTFLQFLLHISIQCQFNGMLIMESYAYSLIRILKNLKCVKKIFQYQGLVGTKDV
jgi:hypothetical protein